MDVLKTAMRILFVEQDPTKIIRKAMKIRLYSTENTAIASMSREEFIDEYLMLDSSRTWDEISNIVDVVCGMGDIWDLLYRYADEKLSCDGGVIYCRYKDLLKWTQIAKYIEADIFIVAFLSKKDAQNGHLRQDFFWPYVLPCNNTRLRMMLSQGMAENHFHLKGSADPFRISWISVMNDIHLS